MTSLRSAVRSDHAALRASQERYGDGRGVSDSVARALITNIGLQQLAVFRCAAWCANHRLTPIAMGLSRLIRHLYSAEMHWNADVSPGVVLVHGNGLVLSRSASVAAGCTLSQQVTLGISRGTDGNAGAPRLEPNVHVAPGAVLVGPITIGAGSKIGPNAFVSGDVEPHSLVTPAPATVTQRPRHTDRNA